MMNKKFIVELPEECICDIREKAVCYKFKLWEEHTDKPLNVWCWFPLSCKKEGGFPYWLIEKKLQEGVDYKVNVRGACFVLDINSNISFIIGS